MNAHNTSAQDNYTPPISGGGQDSFTKANSYTVAGRVFIVEPVFKNGETTTETFGAILLKLMLESANSL